LKRVVVPVFCSAIFEGWNFRCWTNADEPRRNTSTGVRASGLAGSARDWRGFRTQAGLPILPQIKPNQPERQPVAGRMQTALFPDNPIALEGCDLIYLNSEAALALTDPQASLSGNGWSRAATWSWPSSSWAI